MTVILAVSLDVPQNIPYSEAHSKGDYPIIMVEQSSGNSKDKVTCYIDPAVHRRLKIASAVCGETMSSLTEKAVRLYLEHSDLIESLGYGHSYRVHQCPECSTPLVMRQGALSAMPQSQGSVAVVESEIDQGEQNLIPC